MKVLIAGANGQVGRALLSRVPGHVAATGLTHRDLDVRDENAVMSCIRRCGPEVIVNAAAYTAVDRAETEPEVARSVNVDGARNLALAARESGARLIHLSTDFVFDGASNVPYCPDASTNPLNAYGETKRAGEEIVLELLPRRSVVLRTAWIHAAWGSNFVRTMLRLMAEHGSIRVIADQVGTPTSARSVADAVWKLVERPQVTGIHHWTDAGVASWYDFAVAIAEEGAQLDLVATDVTVLPVGTDEYPTRARRPPYSVLDKRSLTRLGFTPVHWRQSLREVLGEIANA